MEGVTCFQTFKSSRSSSGRPSYAGMRRGEDRRGRSGVAHAFGGTLENPEVGLYEGR